MKYSCGIIKDLIPLYIDEVCSEDSVKGVEEHVAECEECKALLESMRTPVKTDKKGENISMEKSLKKVSKKIKIRNIVFFVIGGALMFFILRYIVPAATAIGILVLSSVLSKPKTFTDITEYADCIGEEADEEYGLDPEEHRLYKVFPKTIEGDATEFEYTYYNPFDPQYVSYLTVKYDDEKYEEELERLEKIKFNDSYIKYYSVTDEPEGYDLVAMIADSYYGFGYAMVPEEEDNSITYVGIHFCNYFLDLDVNEYIPDKYLLEGFDATMNNPYENACMGK